MANFQIEKQLEIIIPTYNRKEHLLRTLSQLTAPQSPVRHCLITVLDNACTDGSSALITQFAAQHPNLTHIRHRKNIGGNANITRAFELARLPYVWVVCDDDSFRWEAWGEIQQALQTEKYDALLTRKNDLKGSSDIAKIYRQCTFLPAAIYRTAVLTDGVLTNMYNNVVNMFPHLAIISEIFNRKGSIFLPQGEIMDQCSFALSTSKAEQNVRSSTTFSPENVTHMFWTVGFIASTLMIQDKKLRAYVLEHLGKHGFFGYILGSFRKNYTHYNAYPLNKALVRSALNKRQQIKLTLACALLRITTLFHKHKSI